MAVLRRFLLALAGLLALTLPARAGITFERIDIGDALVILIKGTFERSDDPEALIREVSATAARVVTFDSEGGKIREAVVQFGIRMRCATFVA
ncbi:UNVERIFIED_ORG: hypothetical protein LHK14_19880 [Roseateles sp. XES5]|nr:hypothetical protein [Roseateles sp. XES5]